MVPVSPLLKEAVKEALKLLLLSIWILRGHLYQLGTSVISIITAIEDLKGMKITNKYIRDLLLSVRWVHSGILAVIRPLNWTSIIYFSNYHLSRKFYN